jgi:hypothetical protein
MPLIITILFFAAYLSAIEEFFKGYKKKDI